MMDRGVARKLRENEIPHYKEPIFYLPHYKVHKIYSKSIPLRIVFSSSNSHMGYVLNEFLAKGANSLANT